MSNTSQALDHARTFYEHGDHVGGWHWLQEAARWLPQDIELDEHLVPEANAAMMALHLRCKRCQEACLVTSLGAAADFRDRHYYCGEPVPAWRCHQCDRWGFGFEDECRFCGTLRRSCAPEALLTLPQVREQAAFYRLCIGKEEVAAITCRSLRMARRAARALYPRVIVQLVTDFGRWSEGA